jgi:hypothetical protein
MSLQQMVGSTGQVGRKELGEENVTGVDNIVEIFLDPANSCRCWLRVEILDTGISLLSEQHYGHMEQVLQRA